VMERLISASERDYMSNIQSKSKVKVVVAVAIAIALVAVVAAFATTVTAPTAPTPAETVTALAVESESIVEAVDSPVEGTTIETNTPTPAPATAEVPATRPSTTRRAVNNDGLSVNTQYTASAVYVERNVQQAAADASKEADAAAQELTTALAPANDSAEADVVVGEISNDAPQIGVSGGSAAQDTTEDTAESTNPDPASNGEEEIDNADFESADYDF